MTIATRYAECEDCLVTAVVRTIIAITSTVGSGPTDSTFSRRVLHDSMEISVVDEQMNSAGARSSGMDRQDQEWSAFETTSSRQVRDQDLSAPAPTPSHQTEEQEWGLKRFCLAV